MFAQDARHTTPQPPLPPPPAPALAARLQGRGGAQLQAELAVARSDLDRLQGLLDDASRDLHGHFAHSRDRLDAGAVKGARQAIGSAITALQFHDLASQLIAHTALRLRHCADFIAGGAGNATVGDSPLRPGSVNRDQLAAGSVELF